ADVRTPDYVAPSLGVRRDEDCGFLRRAEHRREPLLSETLAVLRRRECLLRLGMEPVDDWARRLGRNKEPEPWPAFELRVADFRRSRHARKQWIALRRRDRKGPHRVGVDLRHGQREDVEHHRYMAG